MKSAFFGLFTVVGILANSNAFAAPFSVAEGVLDTNQVNLGLPKIEGAKTVTVFSPTEASDHYGNGVVMTGFKGNLYCQWQSSATNEDSEDTWVAYSVGTSKIDENGEVQETWSEPQILAGSISNGYRTSGGWQVYGDTLVAFVNEWPDSMSVKGGFAYYTQSVDGIHWSDLKPVLMKDGTPMQGIIEQDPHQIGKRLVNAAHFQPGLLANPIYTDDLSGRTGWVRAKYTNLEHSGTSSREMEPSIFVKKSGAIVMTFRDQNSSYRRLASVSTDNAESWSNAELTNMFDSRAKQSAGNLPDSGAYLVGNPVTNSTRIPLSITLSKDGETFTSAYNLRTQDELPELTWTGTAKRLGYHYPKSVRVGNYLYVSYATNKELIEYTRIPLEKICDYEPVASTKDETENSEGDDSKEAIVQTNARPVLSLSNITVENQKLLLNIPNGRTHFGLYSVSGKKICSKTWNSYSTATVELSAFPAGVYFVHIANGKQKIVKQIAIQ